MLRRAVLGAGLAILIASVGVGLLCLRGGVTPEPSQDTPEELAYRAFLATNNASHRGKMKFGRAGKEWVAYLPFYRQGALRVDAPQVGFDGGPRRPALLLLAQLAFGVSSPPGGKLESDGASLKAGFVLHDIQNQPFPVEYRVFPRPISETLHLGGKLYSLDRGRVFLVDLSQAPPNVLQVRADLDEYFRGVAEEITRTDLVAVVERLGTLEPGVEAFLEKVPTP